MNKLGEKLIIGGREIKPKLTVDWERMAQSLSVDVLPGRLSGFFF